MRRTKYQIYFNRDDSLRTDGDLTITTRHYPWWGYPFGWYSNGYEIKTVQVYHTWYDSCWCYADGSWVSITLWAWLNEELASHRFRKFKYPEEYREE